MKTWVLVIFLFADGRPITPATATIPGYLTWDTCRLATTQLAPPAGFRIATYCIEGPNTKGLF